MDFKELELEEKESWPITVEDYNMLEVYGAAKNLHLYERRADNTITIACEMEICEEGFKDLKEAKEFIDSMEKFYSEIIN